MIILLNRSPPLTNPIESDPFLWYKEWDELSTNHISSYYFMNEKKNSYIMPIAIIIAGVVIAGAVIYSKNPTSAPQDQTATTTPVVKDEVVTQKDAILAMGHQTGPANPKIIVAEFSDPECPYCVKFQTTMEEVMQKYGTNVAWRFINFFPFDGRTDVHPLSRPLAQGAECAAKLGGEADFWKYMSLVFAQQEKGRSYDIPGNAKTLGIDVTAFNACTKDPAVADTISAQQTFSSSLKINGTPHSIVILPDGTGYHIDGAYPYETVAITLDAALAGVKSGKIQAFLDMFQDRGTTQTDIDAYIQKEFTPAITAANGTKDATSTTAQ